MTEPTPETEPKFSLVAHLNGILEQVRATFEQNDVVLPDRQYIHSGGTGDTVHDCEQVTVSFEQLYSGGPGDQQQIPGGCSLPRTAVVIVEVVRKIPALGDPQGRSRGPAAIPTAAEIEAKAAQQVTDAWLLMEAALAFGDAQQYLGVLADVAGGTPQGGYQATTMTLVASVV